MSGRPFKDLRRSFKDVPEILELSQNRNSSISKPKYKDLRRSPNDVSEVTE